MSACKYVFSFLLSLVCAAASAGEILVGDTEGSIVLDEAGHRKVYENIVGDNYDVRRILSTINGSSAIVVLGKEIQYLPLAVEDDQIVIDCAYSDGRNRYNGARVTAGICGLHRPLDETYGDAAQQYSNRIQQLIFSFDTQPVVEGSTPGSFLLGNIKDIEIYDRYSSAADLENALPKKYIRGPYGCFDFGATFGFLVFFNKDSPELKFLDVLESEEPIKLKRMSHPDLIKLAVNQCW